MRHLPRTLNGAGARLVPTIESIAHPTSIDIKADCSPLAVQAGLGKEWKVTGGKRISWSKHVRVIIIDRSLVQLKY
jgi:hypothetical protein